MTIQTKFQPALIDIFPPFKAKMEAYTKLVATDPEAAEPLFIEAQAIAQAFHAGAEYGRTRAGR